MRIHFLEHETYEGDTNIDLWAQKNNFELNRTFLFKNVSFPSMDEYDLLVVTGSLVHVWEVDKHAWLAPEKDYIKKAVQKGKVILGLCFGAQLLAEALGSRVFVNNHTEIGWHNIQLTSAGLDNSIFQNLPEEFMSFHWHSAHFSLPPGCSRLAFSRASENQAFVCDSAPLIGLQFHPEFTLDLIRRYLGEYGEGWPEGPYVEPLKSVMEQTESIPDTYWLMEKILDNILIDYF